MAVQQPNPFFNDMQETSEIDAAVQPEPMVENNYAEDDEVMDYLSWGRRILSFFIAPAGVAFTIINFVKRRPRAGRTALGWTIAGQVVLIVLYIIFVIVLASSTRHHYYYY